MRLTRSIQEYKNTEDNTQEIINKISRDFSKSLSDKLEFIAREYSTPPIKGDLTASKIKWRGLKMCQHNESWDKIVYWIEQRGKQIGPKIEFNGFKF